ncbi:MAG: hypothetical protein Q4G13_01515 [Moraxella sp.]|nr:hypothetical protein [Moraxella sp.]
MCYSTNTSLNFKMITDMLEKAKERLDDKTRPSCTQTKARATKCIVN